MDDISNINKPLKIQDKLSWGNYNILPDTDILLEKCDMCVGTGNVTDFIKPTSISREIYYDQEAMEYIKSNKHPCYTCHGSGYIKRPIYQKLRHL